LLAALEQAAAIATRDEMKGGLVPAVEEAVVFHGIARHSQPDFQGKATGVTEGPDGDRLGRKTTALVEKLLTWEASCSDRS
jgi:hypothetical protein